MKKLKIIGELINNSYARARRAWTDKDIEGYQKLARLQSDLGAVAINLNLDGTQSVSVKMEEMLSFLPEVIPAIQEVTDCPVSFDNPALIYHKVALENFDRKKCRGAPILNSLAASRQELDGMIELARAYEMKVIVMASEKFTDRGGAQCLCPEDAYETAKIFVSRLSGEADIKKDNIIIDTGLAPVGADTYGLINIGLDAMEMISQDSDTKGVHFSVGLSNFAWGTPRNVRTLLESAYLTLACAKGLDYALASPERISEPLKPDHPVVLGLKEALETGRPGEGETQEEAGYRQAARIMEVCSEYDED